MHLKKLKQLIIPNRESIVFLKEKENEKEKEKK